MGLDGGTIMTRSDVLRGQSWRMSQQDTSRSTRGGCVGDAQTFKDKTLDKGTEKALAWSCCALCGDPLITPTTAAALQQHHENKQPQQQQQAATDVSTTTSVPAAAGAAAVGSAAGQGPASLSTATAAPPHTHSAQALDGKSSGNSGSRAAHRDAAGNGGIAAERSPIVACRLGRLYLRSAVLELLLARRSMFADSDAVTKFYNQQRVAGEAFAHIQTLKDIFDVWPNVDPSLFPSSGTHSSPSSRQLVQSHIRSGALISSAEGSMTAGLEVVCPILGTACSRMPCCAFVACGHIVSDRARAALPDATCPACGLRYACEKGDMVPINGTAEQVEKLRAALVTQAAAKAAAKAAKRKRKESSPQREAVNDPGPRTKHRGGTTTASL